MRNDFKQAVRKWQERKCLKRVLEKTTKGTSVIINRDVMVLRRIDFMVTKRARIGTPNFRLSENKYKFINNS